MGARVAADLAAEELIGFGNSPVAAVLECKPAEGTDMATDGKPHLEVNDQEETILSTHARAAQLEKAVQEARSQIADKSRRRRTWVATAVALVLVGAVVAGLIIAA